MEGTVCFLIMLAAACLLSGPIALIVSIVTSKRVNEIERRIRLPQQPAQTPTPEPPEVIEQPPPPVTEPPVIPEPVASSPQPEQVEIPQEQPKSPVPKVIFEPAVQKPQKEAVSLEQRIGTRWVLIAGVITVVIAAGFFLKFAYENYWIGPWGRIGIAAVAGFVSLVIGEITRRRGYEIAAKGTTALGFAILYAADFTAYRFYDLIGNVPAFAIAIFITITAMAYAVVLNEVVAAFLAMLGGYLAPVIVSKGENLPVPLFGYLLVLSCGAMLCAFWRKWRVINLLALAGTFLLYTGWFEKFFHSQLHGTGPPEQMAIALTWLGIFFGLFLVLPLLYGLVNRAIARKDDVWLVAINVTWTFYYLWTILHGQYRTELAFCVAGLSAAHLAMMGLVFVRCREDVILRRTLLVIGLAFLTIAIPLYWKMNAIVLGWAIEGGILIFIGIRYRSILTQIGGAAAFILACIKLVLLLPMHTDAFRIVLNSNFGIWVFVSVMLWFCHFLYRKDSKLPDDLPGILAQIFYTAGVLVLLSAATLEWTAHCRYNLSEGFNLHYISRGQSIILAATLLLFIVRPFCLKGQLTEAFSLIVLGAGVVFIACALSKLHTEKFLIFINWDFAAVFIFLLSVLCVHIKYRFIPESPQTEAGAVSQMIYAVFGLLFLAVIIAEWYWHCVFNLQAAGISPQLFRGLIIIFAAGVLGFTVRPLCPAGTFSRILAFVLAVVISLFTVILYTTVHKNSFLIFFNLTFAAVCVFVASLLVSAYLLKRRIDEGPEVKNFAAGIALLTVIFLWIVLSKEIYEYWRCRNVYVSAVKNWFNIASMWMSVCWAIYGLGLLAGGFWRKLKVLRYIGLCILGVLLLK
ncbi:MAG: DUF2339 domain-containing protein, partial [Sedimentisphaerales bacterium]|nr:DUF2339 domain-containing protein [Sedimentisphaerales bacterium]